MYNGEGVLTLADGSIYSGEFIDNELDGMCKKANVLVVLVPMGLCEK